MWKNCKKCNLVFFLICEAEMEKNDGYQHWDMHFREQLLRESMETKKTDFDQFDQKTKKKT